jgi:hypothetical protein
VGSAKAGRAAQHHPMASTNGEAVADVERENPPPAEIESQVNKLLSSDLLKASLTLHNLLHFIVSAALEGRADSLKETSIASDVFGRRADFDNRIDPVVRVQAHRLRRKLEKYYNGPGKDDLWIIEIPTGSYVPQFSRRLDRAVPEETGHREETVRTEKRGTKTLVAVVALAVLAGFVLGFAVFSDRSPLLREAGQPALAISPRVRALWDPLLRDGAAPTSYVFWNHLFLSNDKILLRYNGPITAPTGAGMIPPEDLHRYVDFEVPESIGPVMFNWTWASVGQIYQVHALTAMFWSSHRTFRLRPGRLFTTDEGESRNLILGNRRGLDILNRTVKHFEMHAGSYGYKSEDQPSVVNLQPREGEKKEYRMEFDANSQERKADHALIVWLPGRKPDLRIIVCDGLTALGSWAGMEAMTSDDGVEQLEKLLGTPLPAYFEAVVRADIDKDQVIGSKVVAARAR